MASSDPIGRPAGLTTVSFICQQCSAPCKLDSSLGSEINTQIARELVDRVTQQSVSQVDGQETDQPSRPEATPLVYRKIDSLRPIDSKDHVQVWSNDSQGKSSLYHSTQVAQHLFNVMSGNSSVDHPLCEECTDTLLDQLDTALRDAEEENKACLEYFNELQTSQSSTTSPEDLREELEKLHAEEAALVESLKSIDLEQQKINGEKKAADAESKRLEEEEQRYWREYNEYQLELQEFLEENSTVTQKYKLATNQLTNLKKTNVFNDVFHIWHDGHFGTINNFRLGRLPSVPVEWNEINAAWGQTVLLLHTMATRLGFRFSRYRLVPNGSHSRLERIDDQAKELPLYGSSGFKLFWESKFDQAMVAFLECLQQFKDHVESRDVHFKLPYRINKDKIGDSNGELSVKIQLNHEETWTKALKFMLTNLKWCLAWVCKNDSGP